MNKINNIIKQNKEIIVYILVGAMTTFISLISYYILTLFFDPTNPIKLQITNIISWILAVSFAFFANKKYVFQSKNKNIVKEAFKFFESRLLTLIIDIAFMFLMVTTLKINDKFAKILVQFIILVLNYILSKFIVFKKEANNEENY